MGHGAQSIEKNAISQSAIRLLATDPWILTPYDCLAPCTLRLAPATLATYAVKVAVDPTQLTAKALPSSWLKRVLGRKPVQWPVSANCAPEFLMPSMV